MILITHQSHLKVLPSSKFKQHLQSTIQQYSEESDVPHTFIIYEPNELPSSPDCQFVGPNGLLSDLYDEHFPGAAGYQHCFEWVHHDVEHQCYIALHLAHGEFGTYLVIPESVTNANPDLLLAIHSQPLLETLPF